MVSKEGTINITLAAHDNNFNVWKGYAITLNYAHNCTLVTRINQKMLTYCLMDSIEAIGSRYFIKIHK